MRRIFDVPISDTARISRQISNLGGSSSFDQRHFRFYDDSGAINASTALAAEDTDITGSTIGLNTNIRLRFVISDVGGSDVARGSGVRSYSLQSSRTIMWTNRR